MIAEKTVGLLAVVALLVGGCATESRHATAPAARPEVVTVPHLKDELDNGAAPSIILSEIESSGTVYRLTMEQRERLLESGMPAAILGIMQNTYDHAIQKNPDLAKSDDRWLKIGEYWYGGLPAGWPRDWVVGAPRPGELLR